MRNILFNIVLSACLNYSLNAQVSANFSDPLQAAQNLVGNNGDIEIVNAVYFGGAEWDGTPFNLGLFSNGQNFIGFNEGVILSTGSVKVAECLNQAGQPAPCGPQFWRTEGATGSGLFDPDLFLASPGTQFDPAIFEITFKALTEKITFEFVFASEEYNEFVNTGYNDAFGFFLSGPGLMGVYSNNGINLAKVPNTGGDPININNINLNNSSQYYINNNCYALANDPVACNFPLFSYDGFTTILKAESRGLICGEIYKLKLVISNIQDNQVGSAVFLKNGSLSGGLGAGPATAEPDLLCEGSLINLSCPGSANYSYTWFAEGTGQQIGTGQNISHMAAINELPYYVLVQSPDLCPEGIKFYTDITVHTPFNNPPYTLGIDNTGEFIYYATGTALVGQPFSFEIFSYDDLNENVTISYSGVPNNLNQIIENNYTTFGQNHQSLKISGALTQGEYPFTVTFTDNNFCGSLYSTYKFKIIVVCPGCPVDIYYEKRGGANPPLPSATNAVQFIKAGRSVDPNQQDGPVIVNSSQNISFIAGTAIYLEDGFSTESGAYFLAQIEHSSCIDDCSPENCCRDAFTGFTVTNIPNILTPNGDGVNDVWFVADENNPLCAFNIMGFELDIYKGENAWGNNVLSMHENSDYCCAFTSPGPGQPGYSSIYWNGRVQNTGSQVIDGVYVYTLKLIGCHGVEKWYSGQITVVGN